MTDAATLLGLFADDDRLKVVEVNGPDVLTEVVVGGPVSNNKGINLPGVAVSVPALSEKDIEDLRFALHLSVDFVALSFPQQAASASVERLSFCAFPPDSRR